MALIADILDNAGVKIVTSNKPSEITLCCPFCAERDESEDTRFRLGINVNSGFGHCFNCGWSSRALLHTARELCRVFDLKMNLATWSFTRQSAGKTNGNGHPKPQAICLPNWFEELDFTSHGTHDEANVQAILYLRQRGVTRQQIKKHKVGYCAAGQYAYRVLFPVFGAHKKMYGIVGRDFSGNSSLKYLNTTGNKSLWNAQHPTRYAVVSEGIMDALRIEQAVEQWGLHDVTSVARLGSAITDLQLEQLSKFEEVCITPDWDKAGISGAIKLAEACQGMSIKCSVAIPDILDDRDPGSMDTELIIMKIKAAQFYSKAVEYKLRSVPEE